jgi:hypothetical protein
VKQSISKTVNACFYHLRRLKQVLGQLFIVSLVSAIVFMKLGYFNAIFWHCTITYSECRMQQQGSFSKSVHVIT